jgi:tetratricopeptide (TPR) repeat protein
MPTEANAVTTALAALRAGQPQRARSVAERAWHETADARAAAILALIELDAGRVRNALDWNELARARDPANPAYELQSARLLAQLGETRSAVAQLVALVERQPRSSSAWTELASWSAQAGMAPQALRACLDALGRHPDLAPALHAMLGLLPVGAPLDRRSARTLSDRPPISVVTCSVSDERFDRMTRSYAHACRDWPHEFVRISDAASLADGYARGLARASGDVVVFSHDDVEIIAGDFPLRVVDHLSACDILGVAGSTRAAGPAWGHAGRPHLHGCVIYPHPAGYRVGVYSHIAPIARGIRVMDGVVIALSRTIAQNVGWDPEGSVGFHGYDVDFTLRAAKMNLRLAVATDLGVVHHSMGDFGAQWRAAAARIVARHPELSAPPAADTSFIARDVATADEAMALVDRWSLACSGHIAAALS